MWQRAHALMGRLAVGGGDVAGPLPSHPLAAQFNPSPIRFSAEWH